MHNGQPFSIDDAPVLSTTPAPVILGTEHPDGYLPVRRTQRQLIPPYEYKCDRRRVATISVVVARKYAFVRMDLGTSDLRMDHAAQQRLCKLLKPYITRGCAWGTCPSGAYLERVHCKDAFDLAAKLRRFTG